MRRLTLVLTGLLAAAGVLADETEPQPPPVLGAVNVAGVDVSGLSLSEARQRLARELRDKLDTVVRVTDGRASAERTRAELGIGLDLEAMLARAEAGDAWVPLRLKVDRVTFQRVLRGLAPRFAFAGRDAKPYEWRGEFHILPGLYRREVNVGRTAQVWADRLEADPATLRVNVMFEKSPPRVRTEDLAGIDGRLSQFVTRFDPGNVPRTTNLRLAIAAIDGRIVTAGEVFSLNDTVGERTPARGYQKAKIFVDRKVEEGYGGGVSQVTGTLFNAALLGGLEIVTYTTHSRPV
ncbi:MAG: VanW family protein, partial [Armatimonadetes bacterium]|nr:VanW family protein [Armatimonadota bacterium]